MGRYHHRGIDRRLSASYANFSVRKYLASCLARLGAGADRTADDDRLNLMEAGEKGW